MYDTRYGDPVPRILHIEIKPCTNYNGRKKELPNKGAKTVRRNCDNKIFFFFSMEISFDYWETVNSFKKEISPLARFFFF